jgi:hypothetical protein
MRTALFTVMILATPSDGGSARCIFKNPIAQKKAPDLSVTMSAAFTAQKEH